MRSRVITDTYTCDRCRGPIYPDRGYNYQTMQLRIEHAVHDALGNGAGGTRTVDLCDPCTSLFLTFMEAK